MGLRDRYTQRGRKSYRWDFDFRYEYILGLSGVFESWAVVATRIV